MRPYEYAFDKEFQLEVNGHIYNVWVSGMMVKDEFSSAWAPSWNAEIEKVVVSDYLDAPVTPGHEDYDDIMEEINAMDFEEEYSEEMFYDEAR